jgi:hypothetical protein
MSYADRASLDADVDFAGRAAEAPVSVVETG